MAMGTAAGVAVSVGGAIYGAQQQKKATKAANAANMAQEKRAQARLAEGQAKAEIAQKKGIKAVDKGYKKAIGTAGMIGEASRGRVLRREKAAMGGAEAGAANRGLGSSTVAMNARRGVAADTNQQLAQVDEAVAGLVSQIQQNRANTMMQAQAGLASIYSGFASQQASVGMMNQHQAANVGGGIAAAAASIGQLLASLDTPKVGGNTYNFNSPK